MDGFRYDLDLYIIITIVIGGVMPHHATGYYWNQILDVIEAEWKKAHVSPTIREIGEALGKSKPWAYEQVRQLLAKGYLVAEAGDWGALKVASRPPGLGVYVQPVLKISIIGEVGGALVPTHMVSPLIDPEGYACAWMTQEPSPVIMQQGIRKGDLLLVQKRNYLDPGAVGVMYPDNAEEPEVFRVGPTGFKSTIVLGMIVGIMRQGKGEVNA